MLDVNGAREHILYCFFQHPVASTDMWPGRLKRSLLQHPSVFTSIWAVSFDSAVGREPQTNILIGRHKTNILTGPWGYFPPQFLYDFRCTLML